MASGSARPRTNAAKAQGSAELELTSSSFPACQQPLVNCGKLHAQRLGRAAHVRSHCHPLASCLLGFPAMAAANQAHVGKACVRHHCVGVSYASWQGQPHGYHVHLAESAPLSLLRWFQIWRTLPPHQEQNWQNCGHSREHYQQKFRDTFTWNLDKLARLPERFGVHLPDNCAYNGNTKGLKLENHVGHPSGA